MLLSNFCIAAHTAFVHFSAGVVEPIVLVF